jgi:hypothetical protein
MVFAGWKPNFIRGQKDNKINFVYITMQKQQGRIKFH